MLFAKKCLLLVVVVGTVPSFSFGEDRYARFSAVGVELLQPEGFVVAKKWQGLEHGTTPSAVLVTTLPAPPSQTTAGFTAERLKAEGMTLHEKTEVTIAGKPGVLLNVSQTKENVELGKWIAAFGDKTTTMIVGTYPKELEAELGNVVKSIVVGARAVEAKRRTPGGNADLRVGATSRPTNPSKLRDSRDKRPPGPFEPHEIPDERPKTLGRAEREPEPKAQSSRRQRSRSGETARPKIAKLPIPKSAVPEYSYSADDIKRSSEVGRKESEEFEGRAPAGGVLVGLRVVRGTSFGGSVQAVEPIFQVQGRYVTSGRKGEQGEDVSTLLAPAGHAVGGLQVGAGLWTDALRLVYMPVEGARLVVTKPEYSEWIGGNGGRTTEVLSDGSLIVGIAGSVKENLTSIELLYVEPDSVRAVAPANSSKRAKAPAQEMRVWKSASESFSVTAKLNSFDGTQAKLTNKDGKEITVPVEKLSAADRQYLNNVAKSSQLPEKTSDTDSQESK